MKRRDRLAWGFGVSAAIVGHAACAEPAPPRATHAIAVVAPSERPETKDAGTGEPSLGPACPGGKTLDSCIGKIPSQQDLDEVFGAATRLEIGEVGVEGEFSKVLASSDQVDLSAVMSALSIDSTQGYEASDCTGDLHISLFRGNEVLAELRQNGQRLHWEKWRGDAVLQNPKGLSDWLHTKGIGLLVRELNGYEKEAERARLERSRWEAAMPAAIKGIWKWQYNAQTESKNNYLAKLGNKIEKTIPDQSERALVLFEWFGAGARKPKGGFPSYELAIPELLSRIPIDVLVAVARRSDLTEGQKRGALRYFRQIVKSDPVRAAGIPVDVVEHLAAEPFLEELDRGMADSCPIDWGFGTLYVKIGGEPVYVYVDGHLVAYGREPYKLRPGSYEVAVDIVYAGVKGKKRVTIQEGQEILLESKDFVDSKAKHP